MRYMLMLQSVQADYDAMAGKASPGSPVWSGEDLRVMFRFMRQLNEDLAASGEFVDAQGLTEPAQATVVSSDEDGRPVLSELNYGEDQEILAGFWVLECKTFERATEIAARVHQCPVPEGSRELPVIVRPIQQAPPPVS